MIKATGHGSRGALHHQLKNRHVGIETTGVDPRRALNQSQPGTFEPHPRPPAPTDHLQQHDAPQRHRSRRLTGVRSGDQTPASRLEARETWAGGKRGPVPAISGWMWSQSAADAGHLDDRGSRTAKFTATPFESPGNVVGEVGMLVVHSPSRPGAAATNTEPSRSWITGHRSRLRLAPRGTVDVARFRPASGHPEQAVGLLMGRLPVGGDPQRLLDRRRPGVRA